jgi:CTD nuclear envelope phosphatase 1
LEQQGDICRMLLDYIRLFFRRLQYYFVKTANVLSFGRFEFISESSRKFSSVQYNKLRDSLECLHSSSNSSDSDIAEASPRSLKQRRSPRDSPAQSELIANEAIAHSYEDITQPDYRNYLWLSSQWDRTDLCSAFYFILNWSDYFKNSAIAPLKSHDADEPSTKPFSSFIPPNFRSKTVLCRTFIHFLDTFRGMPDSFFPKRRISMPKKLKTLILDLDETLIHSTATSCQNFDFMVEVLVNRASCLYYVLKRPHLDHFLNVVSNWYNLVIYTASVREYADPVINLIDDNRRYFKKRLFRSDCTQTSSSHYLKDISLIECDLSKICLLDNSAPSFALFPDNAIPIESWRDDQNDSALLDLLPFLDALRFVDDVRSILSLRRLLLFCNK